MAHLPSYKQAIAGPGIPLLISSYLDAADLLLCARVNKEWNNVFNPLIWADPVGIIAKQSNPFRNVYQFLAQLPAFARENAARTCDLITTLDFRPILSLRHLIQHQRQYSDYEYLLTTQFICKTFVHLPNIRFVIFEGLKMEEYKAPFVFMNAPLAEIKKILAISAHGMQELDPNWIKEFYHLVYLDISYTARAENFGMAFNADSFVFLRVLKMRGLRLTGNLVPPLVYSTGRKLWSLVRDNTLRKVSESYIP
ncbi:hypothetical protein HYFRA_00002703 [Hymenoscyphus fraxineus]|uniref:F-box domain-containing protein n=1 Tax=Hymenoscyphus fraxineus TaxID=746836 RepID=A0A9N9PZ81_9HELO|nr:hypothetical protein HYFRA_00002703 [Hymenoscyphus fraxineus]